MNAIQICLVFAVLAMIPSNAQRSPYVPQPWNYPGLLPRFGEEDNSAATPSTTQRPRPQQRPQPRPQFVGNSNDAVLGNRIGGGSDRNRSPCVECYIYVTRNGDMIRVNRDNVKF